VLHAFFMAAFPFVIGGFTLQLSGADISVAPRLGSGSALSQAVLGVIYLASGFVLAVSPRATRTLQRTWPIFLLPALAVISALWSPDAGLTVRRAIALTGTIVFGLSIVSALSPKSSLALILRALSLAMLLSVVWVFVFAPYGAHGATDAVQPEHAGKWRGIFAHKNVLGGQIAGATLAFLILYGREAFESVFPRALAIGVTALCLLMAQSGTGYVMALLITLVGLCARIVAAQPVQLRVSLLLFLLAASLVVSLFAPSLANLVLSALGKDPDLTGRTEYWANVLPHMNGHWAIGHGYYSGLLSLDTLNEGGAIGAGGTHNGYIDILVSLGLLGLIVAMAYLGWLLAGALGKLLSPAPSSLKTFPLCAIAFVVSHNFVESSILAGNTLPPLMAAAAAGMLARDVAAKTPALAVQPVHVGL
jgi:O-antigen ligase